MSVRLHARKLVGSALLTLLALQFVPSAAMAAKEKFERTKPHVNVGTIGNQGEESPNQLTTSNGNSGSKLQPGQDCEPDPAKATETRPAC